MNNVLQQASNLMAGRSANNTSKLPTLEAWTASSLWVVNTSANSKYPQGVVSFSVTNKDGGDEVVKVPKTWVPIDLCSFVPLTILKESTSLRGLITRNLIRIISEEEATKILESPGAQKELLRALGASDDTEYSPHDVHGNSPESSIDESQVDDFVKGLVSKVKSNKMTPQTAADMMRTPGMVDPTDFVTLGWAERQGIAELASAAFQIRDAAANPDSGQQPIVDSPQEDHSSRGPSSDDDTDDKNPIGGAPFPSNLIE